MLNEISNQIIKDALMVPLYHTGIATIFSLKEFDENSINLSSKRNLQFSNLKLNKDFKRIGFFYDKNNNN
jgi:hypothetical protein